MPSRSKVLQIIVTAAPAMTILLTLKLGIAEWLERPGYKLLAEIKGIMSPKNRPDRSDFERGQYVNSLITFMDDPSCVA